MEKCECGNNNGDAAWKKEKKEEANDKKNNNERHFLPQEHHRPSRSDVKTTSGGDSPSVQFSETPACLKPPSLPAAAFIAVPGGPVQQTVWISVRASSGTAKSSCCSESGGCRGSCTAFQNKNLLPDFFFLLPNAQVAPSRFSGGNVSDVENIVFLCLSSRSLAGPGLLV